MKHLNLITLISLLALSAATMFGQSIQKGFVYEYNDKMEKVPLSNVEIVVTNAASTVSDANGEFTLRFRQLKPGDRIIMRRCIKSGYSIADEVALEHLYITGDDSKISILLCKTEKLMEVRRNMVRQATEKATTRYEEDQRQLAITLQQQEITKEDYERKLEELRHSYEAKLDNIDNYIDRFVKLDLTALTAEEKRILNYVREGNFDKAIEAYDKLDLSGRLIQQSKNISRLSAASEAMQKSEQSLHNQQKELRNAVLRQCDLIRMQGGKDVDIKVCGLIKELAMVDTTNVYNMLVYARLMLGNANYQEAHRVYESLCLSASDSTALLRAQCYNALSIYRMGRRAEGIEMMEHYLPILDSLRLHHSDTLTLLRDEAEFYNLMGAGYKRTERIDEANRAFRRSIKFLRTLRIETKLKDIDAQYAVYLSQSAMSMSDEWGEEGAQMCREAVVILEELYQKKPYLYDARLGYAYKCLGSVYKKNGNREEAEIALLEAERYYGKAVQRHPQAYSRFLAFCLLELGEFYLEGKDYNRSLQCLEGSQEIFLKQPDGRLQYSEELSKLNRHIGKCSYHLGDYDKALKCDQQSLEDMEPLYKAEPVEFREQMGQCLLYLSNVHIKLRDYKKADFYIHRAYEVNPDDPEIARQVMEVAKLLQYNP